MIDRLDHVAVVSPHPDSLFAAYEAMGFQLTPISRHSGSVNPGEKPVPFGNGNRCAMLKRGYLEFLAIFDPTMPCGPFPALVERYEGLHIVAFGCEDPDAVERRWRETGVPVDGVFALERELETQEGTRLARFTLLRPPADHTPEMRFNAIRHETPDYLWQPHLMDHPNRAVSLDAVTVAVADPDEAAARYGRILGIEPTRADQVRRIDLRQGRLDLVAADDIGAAVPGAVAPTLPFVAAFTLSSEDLGASAACLEENAVPFVKEGGRVIVPADAGCGAICVFEAG